MILMIQETFTKIKTKNTLCKTDFIGTRPAMLYILLRGGKRLAFLRIRRLFMNPYNNIFGNCGCSSRDSAQQQSAQNAAAVQAAQAAAQAAQAINCNNCCQLYTCNCSIIYYKIQTKRK